MKYVIICSIMIIAALTAFLPHAAFTVKGKVTEGRGMPLHDVSVTEKGTANIVQTDASGDFVITVSNADVILVFSALGFDTKEIKLSGKPVLQVQLSVSVADLQDTVITNCTVKKKDFTELKAKESEAAAGLQARVASTLVRVKGPYPPPVARNRRAPYYRPSPEPDDGFNTEDYDGIVENRFRTVKDNPLSTFSIDVDAASYSNVRRFINNGQLPPAGAVRTEELINYFHYDYPQPEDSKPFSIYTELSEAPWNSAHRLVLIGLQGRKIATENIPPSNLVFLIDVSGSMDDANKLPLVKQSMKMLTDQLREKDKVAIVVYAGSAGLVLPATRGSSPQIIKDAIDRLTAGGSTAGGEGIKLAYTIARQNFIQGGNNRVILCTDGDFNVGASSDAEMEKLIEQERKSGVFLTVLGYGMGNYKDNKMQKLADKGNGNHAYIDDISEAKKVLVSEFGGTLFTIAKDVKLQVEFNPAKVEAYRLIGYENRMLNQEDFNNDAKDAGELGSGHTVTALYEVIPAGVKSEFIEEVDPLKYGGSMKQDKNGNAVELMTIKFRYKTPDKEKSRLVEHPVVDGRIALNRTSDNFRLAAAVAQFGMLLTHSEFKQGSSYNNVMALAHSAIGGDSEGYRKGFIELVKKAGTLAKNEKNTRGNDGLAGRK